MPRARLIWPRPEGSTGAQVLRSTFGASKSSDVPTDPAAGRALTLSGALTGRIAAKSRATTKPGHRECPPLAMAPV